MRRRPPRRTASYPAWHTTWGRAAVSMVDPVDAARRTQPTAAVTARGPATVPAAVTAHHKDQTNVATRARVAAATRAPVAATRHRTGRTSARARQAIAKRNPAAAPARDPSEDGDARPNTACGPATAHGRVMAPGRPWSRAPATPPAPA